MDKQAIRLKELFEEVLPRFGLGHAKICRALFSGDVKTARQLYEETGISYHKIYSMLRDLSEQGVVSSINTSPINYHIKGAERVFDRLVNKKIRELEKIGQEFDRILLEGNEIDENEREYVVKINTKSMQTRLFDNKNKTLVQEAEAKELVQQLNNYAQKLGSKKEYAYAIYR